MRNQRILSVLCFLLIAVMLAGMAAAEEEGRTVRVAFPTQEGMSFIGGSGKVTGYNYDFLQKIAEYTGWEMEYVLYPSNDGNEAVSNAIADLQAGNVDLLGPMLKNDATLEMFEYPENSYGTVYTTLCALSTSGLREQNIGYQKHLRVGLWDHATTRNAEVIAYLEGEKLDYEIIYYSMAAEQKQALYDGKVDVISSVSISPIDNTRIVAQFAPRPYYFAATKGDTELVETLDQAIIELIQTEPKLQDTLYNTYFRDADDAFLLTDEQRQKISGMGTLDVLCIDKDAPYVYQENGEPKGMLISILDDFAETVGVEVKYVFCKDRSTALEQMETESYDMLVGVSSSSASSSRIHFINSAPIIAANLAYITRPDASKGHKIAITTGLDDIIDLSSYDEVISYDSAEECLSAINTGKVDIAAGDRSVMEYYIFETGSSLTSSLIPETTQNICIGVSRNIDSTLLRVLNNYIYSISKNDLAVYLSEGNVHSDTFSLSRYIRTNPIKVTLFIIVATTIIAGFAIWQLSRNAKKQAALQQQHNDQLRQALQIAKEANASKTTFLSNMSHDIRTPMNAVMGFSTLLAREPDDSVKVKEYARKITAASNHLLGLINDILDISKIESGKVTLNQSVFSINELLESINVVVRPMAGAKKQTFQIRMGILEHELFVGDKVRVNQVLINLLTNAIKYTQIGGTIQFRITDIGATSSNFEKIRFEVIDNGCGISEEFREVIFEPFTRAENSTVNREVGTGLGLAITKNIVDLMGGQIDVTSELGKGSTFTVELPLRLPHEENDENFWEKRQISRILLVDDEKHICDGIKANMADTGVKFDAVYSGEDAVELVKKQYAKDAENEYSAIILDWQMPGMDGLQTAKEIRKIIPIDTPILFLTSYDWSEIETEALQIDVDGFLAKPFTVVNLKEKLLEVEHFKNAVAEPDVEIDLKGLHFLIVEDNELNAEILAAILDSEGATSEVVENGQLAVDKFESTAPGTFDAILMDVMMPVLNGYDATRLIRASKHPEAQSVPIIAMTANAFVKDVQDALDSGMNAHIAKPVNLKTLKSTLGSCIRNRRY